MPPPNCPHAKARRQEASSVWCSQGRRDASPNGRATDAWCARRRSQKGQYDWHLCTRPGLHVASHAVRPSQMNETGGEVGDEGLGSGSSSSSSSSSSSTCSSGRCATQGQRSRTHPDVAELRSEASVADEGGGSNGGTPLRSAQLSRLIPTKKAPLRCHDKLERSSREGSTPASSTLCVSARLDGNQERCRRAAYDVSFHGDSRVKEHTTHVLLHGASFLLVERTVPGNNTGVYQRSRKVWEHVPIGQVRVFAATASGSARSSTSNSSGGPTVAMVRSDSASTTPVSVGEGDCSGKAGHNTPPLRGKGSVREADWPRGGSGPMELEDGEATQPLRGSPTSCTTTTGYELVATLNGLRKFGHFDEVSTATPCQAASTRSLYAAQNGLVSQAVALTRVDGESGQLTAFKHDGVRYWLVGCQERHVLVRLWVPEEDVMLYSESENGVSGATNQEDARHMTRAPTGNVHAVTRVALAQRMALAWRHVLQNDVGDAEAVLRLHNVVRARQWTLCFSLVSTDWEHLVDYWSTPTADGAATLSGRLAPRSCAQSTGATHDARGDVDGRSDVLRFFAITSHAHSSRGLCMPVAQALAFFDTYHLPRVAHSVGVEVNSAEYGTLRQEIATEMNSAGAVFYGMNDQGDVVRLWKCRCYLYTLERAAQEAILSHRLQGAALRSRLQKKLASLPRDVVRGCTEAWGQSRLEFLTSFAGWLHRTRRLTASTDLAATRELRSHWVSAQQLYRRTVLCCAHPPPSACRSPDKSGPSSHSAVASENDTSVSCNAQRESSNTTAPNAGEEDADEDEEDTAQSCSRTDVIMLVGPQGCGKSTLARTLCALLEQAGYVPRWVNQDEVGNRRAYLAAISRAVGPGEGARCVTHVILDKMNLNDDMRADYDALRLKIVLTVAWAHARGMDALGEVCVRRVLARGNSHRTFRLLDPSVTGCDQDGQAGQREPQGGPAARMRSRSSSRQAGMTAGRMERIVRSCVAQYELPCDPSLLQLDITLSPDAALERVWARLQERGLYELPPLTDLAVQAAFDTALQYERLLQQYAHRITTVILRAVAPEAIIALLPDAVRQETRLRRPVLDEVSVTLHNFVQQPCPVALVHYAGLVGTQCLVELQGVVADPFAALLVVRPWSACRTCAASDSGGVDRSAVCPCDEGGRSEDGSKAGRAGAGLATHHCAWSRGKGDGRVTGSDGGQGRCVDFAVVARAKRASQTHYDDLADHFACGGTSDLYRSVVRFAAETRAPFVYQFTF